jgi:aminoglycoside phosphotransferase (APT) family kinase protein
MDVLNQLADPERALPLLSPHAARLLGPRSTLSRIDVVRAWRRTWAKPAQRHREYLEFYLRLEGRSPAGATRRRSIHGLAALPGALPAGADYSQQLELPTAVLCFEPLPRDRALPQLAALTTRTGCATALPVPARELLGGPPEHVELVSFRPGQRAVLRATRAERSVFGKMFARGAHERQAQQLADLQHLVVPGRGQVAVPRLLGHDASLGVLWLSGIAGRSATDWLASPYGSAWVGRVLGEALAHWHRADAPADLPILTPERLMTEAQRKLRKIQHAGWTPAELCGPLLDLLPVRLAQLPHCEPALIHGDVHPGQFLIDNARRVGLCDLDEIALGDPERDLAQLLERMPGGELLESWQRHARRPLRLPILAWYQALSAIDRAYREYSMRGLAARANIEQQLMAASRSLA